MTPTVIDFGGAAFFPSLPLRGLRRSPLLFPAISVILRSCGQLGRCAARAADQNGVSSVNAPGAFQVSPPEEGAGVPQGSSACARWPPPWPPPPLARVTAAVARTRLGPTSSTSSSHDSRLLPSRSWYLRTLSRPC